MRAGGGGNAVARVSSGDDSWEAHLPICGGISCARRWSTTAEPAVLVRNAGCGVPAEPLRPFDPMCLCLWQGQLLTYVPAFHGL